MAKNHALSLRVQWLGERLRKARKRAGYTLEQAADFLQLSTNSLSCFERGTLRVRRSYIRDLIDFYGIANHRERDALFQLSEDAWRRDWWDGDTSDLEIEFIDHTWLEARAEHIWLFEPTLVSGLVQTRDYAAALIAEGSLAEPRDEQITRMVEVRMMRQRIINQDPPTKLTLVMEEAPFLRTTGGNDCMRDQIGHLLKQNARSHIDIRILPPSLAWHPGLNGPFTYFNMPDPYPDVAYTENLVGRAFLEERDRVERYRRAYDDLYRLSRDSRETNQFLQRMLKEIE